MRERFGLQLSMADRVEAGLQTGMAGALVMLMWLSLSLLWSRHSIWWFPNLMATAFAGDSALQQTLGKYTMAGLSLHLAQYCLVGVLFALVMPSGWIEVPAGSSRLLLAGLLIGVAWYYFMYGVVWKHFNPLIALYSPDRAVLVGHVFYGLMLGRLPRYVSASVPTTE